MTVSLCIKQEVEVGLPVFVLTLCANILVSCLEEEYIFFISFACLGAVLGNYRTLLRN